MLVVLALPSLALLVHPGIVGFYRCYRFTQLSLISGVVFRAGVDGPCWCYRLLWGVVKSSGDWLRCHWSVQVVLNGKGVLQNTC